MNPKIFIESWLEKYKHWDKLIFFQRQNPHFPRKLIIQQMISLLLLLKWIHSCFLYYIIFSLCTTNNVFAFLRTHITCQERCYSVINITQSVILKSEIRVNHFDPIYYDNKTFFIISELLRTPFCWIYYVYT